MLFFQSDHRAMPRRLALQCLSLGLAASTLLVATGLGAQDASGLQLAAPQALADSRAGKVVLIDVRTPDEWKQTGVPQGALRINMNQPGGEAGFVAEVLRQVKGDKNVPVALVCRSGNRSGQTQRWLEKQGFKRVYDVSEGVSGGRTGPGWVARGLPLE